MDTPTRIKDIPTTATTAAADDYFVIDGATNGSRKYAHNSDPAAHFGFLRPITTEWVQLLSGSATGNTGSGSASVAATTQQMQAASGATAGSVGSVRSTYLPVVAGGTVTPWGAGFNVTRADFPMVVRIDALTTNGSLAIAYGLSSSGNADLAASKCWGIRITKTGALARWQLAINDGVTLNFSDPIDTPIDSILRYVLVSADGAGSMRLYVGAASVALAAPVGAGGNFLWIGARNNADAANNGLSLFGFRAISAK